MNRRIVSAACGLWLGLSALAPGAVLGQVAEPVVVVELYTSQGCSSCPPADEYLARLADQDGVLPLALHVDYWDYIGWVDSFAQPKFTDRQRAYAAAAGSRTIYTPQMVVGGVDLAVGSDEGEVDAKIRRHRDVPASVALEVTRNGASLTIAAKALAPLPGPLRVQLVRYQPSETVAIERGENAGMTVTYRNIVTSWQKVGAWSGAEDLALNVEAPGPEPLVVIVQTEDAGPILAAASLR
jgi:hypothetical protein